MKDFKGVKYLWDQTRRVIGLNLGFSSYLRTMDLKGPYQDQMLPANYSTSYTPITLQNTSKGVGKNGV